MNISKFTQKSIQAVQDLEKIAYEYGNQEIEQEHLLYALLTQEDSLILKLIEKMEINKDYFLNTVKTALVNSFFHNIMAWLSTISAFLTIAQNFSACQRFFRES